ncbi:MAG TPA: DUF2911 domain-containing protein [Longimicrobiales bacterium]
MRSILITTLALTAVPLSGEALRDSGLPEIGQQVVTCKPQRPTTNRASAYDSTVITIAGRRALICYGRPAARGRTMIGGEAVPYGKLWRTGANEPTTLHIPFAATIAGVAVTPGSYSIYTVPGEKQWEVIVNRSTSQWGHEGRYTDEVKAQEVGRGRVASSALKDHVEVFTIRSTPAQNGADLVLEWEKTRVAVPIRVSPK